MLSVVLISENDNRLAEILDYRLILGSTVGYERENGWRHFN